MAVSSKLHLLVMITLIFVPVPSSQFQNHNHTRLEQVHRDRISSSTKLLNHSRRFLARIWCYNQDDPVFNPTTSTLASYTVVPCGSPACDALLLNDRRCHAGKCGYKVNYADGSYTKGTLMLETLTFGLMRIHNMAMGCGHNNQGSFNVIAGLLGLGGRRMSFVNQIPEIGGAFSYCLPSYSILSPGWLRFGRGLGGAFPVGAAWALLVYNPRAQNFYC
ncbi:hypothetical protein LWI29_032803 [Acer saccharum]|uniref:Xylanase inhibitor N-terminal domain-containing protein n=1 Tax=Acer saccharum TaxID=4024 RepID=A0AA39RMT2_ACESA|nr:hypothetical protein LWI29_032803 [Acer saccharum]